MASGPIAGFWRRVRNAMHAQWNPSHADPGMDTPERAAEKKHDPERFRPDYPGGNVPSGAWTGIGPH